MPSSKLLYSSSGLISSEITFTSVVSDIRRMKSRQAMMSPTSMATVRSKIIVRKNVMSSTVTSLFGLFISARNERHPDMP